VEVTVRYIITLREVVGKREEKISLPDGSTVEDVLLILAEKYGENFERYAHSGREGGLQLLFLINGRNVAYLDGLKTRLDDGVTLAIIPPVAGG